MPEKDLPSCERCRKPGELAVLYGRGKDGVAIKIGRLGPRCFYIMARQLVTTGYSPEREDASPVVLRGGR
jgi:hypothetical protein